MANELKTAFRAEFAKDNVSVDFFKSGMTLDVTGKKYVKGRQNIGTSAEALGLGEISSCGLLAIYNHDSTNYISVRAGSGGADVVKVPPKNGCLLFLSTNSPHGIANTAACDVEYLLVEA